MIKKLTVLVFVSLLSGCASTNAPQPKATFSAGGQLLVQNRISSSNTLSAYAEAQQKHAEINNISSQQKNLLANSDLLFGSGLVGSTAFFAQTGVWLNPGNFLDKTSLGMFAASFLAGTGMRYHPWTYTYFFHQSTECNERKCVEDNFEAFAKDMMREYFAHESATFNESDVINIDYARANLMIDRFAVYGQFNHPAVKRGPPLRIMNATNLKRMYQAPIPTWGNVEPTKFQDAIGLPGLNYQQTAELLLKISAAHPTILVFIGIDRTREKTGEPCFGGFFIKAGNTIPVTEMGCMNAI